MRDVAVDPRALVATVAGGARAKDVAAAVGAHGPAKDCNKNMTGSDTVVDGGVSNV
jgi:hypothetical protein